MRVREYEVSVQERHVRMGSLTEAPGCPVLHPKYCSIAWNSHYSTFGNGTDISTAISSKECKAIAEPMNAFSGAQL